MARQDSPSTIMIARIAGPYLLISGAAVALRGRDVAMLVEEFARAPSLVFLTGALTLLAGLIMLAVHQRWGTLGETVVSLVGWLVVLRGFMLLATPNLAFRLADDVLGTQQTIAIVGSVFAGLGVYLTMIGLVKTPAPAR
jgi:hypothetical protein